MVRSVLIVDDEPNIVRSLQFLMTKAGYDVRVARDGEQALDEIAKTQPDLVLLDVMMPKRDGFDVNYLRVTLCNIHDEFTKRLDAPAVTAALRAG